MRDNIRYRAPNTIITAIGVIASITAGFIPAPYGLLSDGSISLIQALPGTQKITLFGLPAVLFIIALLFVAKESSRLTALLAVLTGGCLFAWMDLKYVKAAQPFTGTFISEAGIVIAVCGVLLYALGTPVEKKKAAKKKETTVDTVAESRPEATIEEERQGDQHLFYGDEDNEFRTAFERRDTMEFRDTLVAAIKEITDTNEDPEENVIKAPVIETASVIESTAWESDSELENLLRMGGKRIEEASSIATPEIVTTEDISTEIQPAEDAHDSKLAEDKSITDFYTELEEMFK